jgi:hypothetical protein
MKSTLPAIEIHGGHELSGVIAHALISNRSRDWISAIRRAGGIQGDAIPVTTLDTIWDQRSLHSDSGQTGSERTRRSFRVCLEASDWSNAGVEDLGHIPSHVVEVSPLNMGAVESEGHGRPRRRSLAPVHSMVLWRMSAISGCQTQ